MLGMYAIFYDKVPCHLIHVLSIAVLFPTLALSESHCLIVDGGETGSGALIQLSHSTFLLNIVIRWLFKISAVHYLMLMHFRGKAIHLLISIPSS